jgi:hypothetical protein
METSESGFRTDAIDGADCAAALLRNLSARATSSSDGGVEWEGLL